MLQAITATQILGQHDYEILDQVVSDRDFPLLVRHQSTIYVAKLVQPAELDVVQQLQQSPIKGMPRVIDWFQDDAVIVMIEEFVNGQTLAAKLTEHGPFAPLEVKQIAVALLNILTQLHQLNIVHRDIKLSNIMVSGPAYYLIDISAAREYKPEQTSDTRLLGTSGFAAPENYGFAQTDVRSDLFSLGVVLNCLLTGYVPTESQMVRRFLTANAVWQPIIQKAIEIDPRQRYQTTGEMLQAIQNTTPAPHLSPVQPAPNRTIQWLKSPALIKWLRRIGWGIYWVFLVASALVATTTGTRGDRFWSLTFVLGMLVLPVAFHHLNRWLYRLLPRISLLRWRIGLILLESFLFIYFNVSVANWASLWHAHVFP